MVSYSELMGLLSFAMLSEKIWRPIRDARESLSVPFTVSSHEELSEVLSGSYNQLYKAYLHTDVDMPPEEASSRLLRLLRIPNLVPVYHNCTQGVDGGIPAVVDMITRKLEEEGVETYNEHILTSVLSHPQNYDEIFELMTAYVNEFGTSLGFELRDVPSMCLSWKEILRDHARQLNQHRSQVGRF